MTTPPGDRGDLIEAMARGFSDWRIKRRNAGAVTQGILDAHWHEKSGRYRAIASAHLAAIEAAGCVVVPGEPADDGPYRRPHALEEEIETWKSVFPDIAPENVQRDRSVVEEENSRLREVLGRIACWHVTKDPLWWQEEARAALEPKRETAP